MFVCVSPHIIENLEHRRDDWPVGPTEARAFARYSATNNQDAIRPPKVMQ